MRTSTWSATVISALTIVAGCMPPPAVEKPPVASEWVGPPGKADLRKMTALVKVTPPKALKETFERVAARTDDQVLSGFFSGFASGVSGSGFVMVRRGEGGERAFIVTNRHVVEGAENAEITFTDGSTYPGCEIVYVDRSNDIAVLSFPNDKKVFSYGLEPYAGAVRERQTVVATGFPEMGGHPNYQITDGKISNKQFQLKDRDDQKTEYVQHTAPIDPGSSGGPLTTDDGQLVGVNTMFMRNKHAAFFAVPSTVVQQAVRTAYAIKQNRARPEWMKAQLVEACHTLTGELSSRTPKLGVVDNLVSNKIVATDGLLTLLPIMQEDKWFQEAFVIDPMRGMRRAILVKLMKRFDAGGGLSGSNTCDTIARADHGELSTGGNVRMFLKLDKGPMEIAWTYEHGHWRVAGGGEPH